MFKKYLPAIFLLGLSPFCFAFEREVAITIDDLPFVGSANYNMVKLERERNGLLRIMQVLVDNNVPATGFVISGSIEKGQWELLEQFKQAGFDVGNHTHTHENLNTTSAEKYIANIDKADKKLASLMTTSPRYFRYPYLAEGTGSKRKLVQQYLKANDYVVAPVTIDSKDFLFNYRLYKTPKSLREERLAEIKKKYLAFIWRETLRAENEIKQSDNPDAKQILLIHANWLNSYCMAEVIEMFRNNGYRFVTLGEALASQKAPRIHVRTMKKDPAGWELL